MPAGRQSPDPAFAAALVVIDPSGHRAKVPLDPLPYSIGRQADNTLVLRDNRASRNHARILKDGADYLVEDLNSRHGVFVNGEKVTRRKLINSDRIDFGFQDSYKLVFTLEEDEIHRLLDQISPPLSTVAAPGSNLAKLRALVEVARALQSSLSTQDVLVAVVDAALAVTGCERGFLLLRDEEKLNVSVARDRHGSGLASTDLKVPMTLINRALRTRRELLSMNFDPSEAESIRPDMSVANLELRSVVCVPLVHVRTGGSQDTIISSVNDTVGLLYMDSRQNPADLSQGNREILQTLALEASTILENARLLDEERAKQRMDEELKIARDIQRDLLPSHLPSEGWFRAAGSSVASHHVGGDYFDLRQAGELWSAIVADVSGKGVSSALLASLLQGAFLLSSDGPVQMEQVMGRINRFLSERAKGEKYATVFYCTVDPKGLLSWANAGHPKPFLVRPGAELFALQTTGTPLGMLEMASYGVEQIQLAPGDKVVIFSDGLSEAENPGGQFFDRNGLRETIRKHADKDCAGMHAALLEAVNRFIEGGELSDDITLLVLEYRP